MNINYLVFIMLIFAGCAGNSKTQDQTIHKNQEVYDLNNPEKFIMPDVLHEISGIAFNKDNYDSIYAEQDEEGKVYHFKLGDQNLATTKFGKRGDFEDITICNGTVVMLRSDGVLFSFPLSETTNKDAENVKEWDDLLPQGEYEGLYADEAQNKLYVLCKHCSDDITSQQTNGHIFKLENDSIKTAGNFSIDVTQIEKLSGQTDIKFHPSALGRSPITGDWYIVTSVNKLLITADSNWQIKRTFALNDTLFNQPEGIAFDKDGNLFISNEGGKEGGVGTILKFKRNN